jgi:hypothetical protein
MQLYGFPPSILFDLLSHSAINPTTYNTKTGLYTVDVNINTAYTYNANLANLGSPNIPTNCNDAIINKNFPDWISTLNNKMDVRGFYSKCCGVKNASYCPIFTWPNYSDVLKTVSPITKLNVAFTT